MRSAESSRSWIVKRGIEANFQRIFPQKPRADRMKCARPGEGVGHDAGLRPQHLGRDALDTALHLRRGAARECQQHHAARIDARDDEMRHAVRQRVGFAGAGAGNDQQGGTCPRSPQPCSTARR